MVKVLICNGSLEMFLGKPVAIRAEDNRDRARKEPVWRVRNCANQNTGISLPARGLFCAKQHRGVQSVSCVHSNKEVTTD